MCITDHILCQINNKICTEDLSSQSLILKDLYSGHIFWLDNADLSDHCPIVALQALKVQCGQCPSLSDMDHLTSHKRDEHMATGLVIELVGCENWQ